MEINLSGHRRVPLAMLAAFAAMPLFAESALIEQGRAAINRGDSDAAIEILEKAVAQVPKSAEAYYVLGSAASRCRRAECWPPPNTGQSSKTSSWRHLDYRDTISAKTIYGAVLGGGVTDLGGFWAFVRSRT